MIMANKVVKIEIRTDEEIKLLFEIMFEVRHIMNKTVAMMYEWSNFASEYKKIHSVYPKPPEILLKDNGEEYYKTVGGYISNAVRNEYPKSISANCCSSIMGAIKLYKSKEKGMYRGECTIPFYKNNNCINVHGKNIQIYKDDKYYYMDVGILSTEYRKELSRTSGRFKFNLILKAHQQKEIIKYIHEDVYKICESEIRYDRKNKKFFVHLTYQYEPVVNNARDKDKILTVVFGDENLADIRLKNTQKQWHITFDEINAFKASIDGVRSAKKNQRNYCGDGSRQHGRGRFLRPVINETDKINNFNNLANHRYSKFIVNIARRNKVGLIEIADSDSKDWSFFELKNKIDYKAKALGIDTLTKK